jgi:hypothetical protein
VLVAGFEPNAGTVATMMGGESRGRRDARPAHRSAERHAQPRPQQGRSEVSSPRSLPARPQQAKPSDPIFSRPYEPGTAVAAAAPKAAEPVAAHGKTRARPVAALLGGLKRA